MTVDISTFKPVLLWKYFGEISRIPRCSKNEEAIARYITSVAEKFGLEYKTDDVGNIVIKKPATPGKENVKTVVLQGHMDMVCEKNSDVEHDFTKDPITFRQEGDYLYANGTTLGADNGIGVAASLAIAEDNSFIHGPLELMFTVDEETGLTGAFNMGNDMLAGRTYMNLDSEEEGALYIGCAGGADSRISLPVERIPVPAHHDRYMKIHVHGLKGGHSGLDINTGRANAIKVLVRLLRAVAREGMDFALYGMNGGNKRNAIAREAFAGVSMPADQAERFRAVIESEAKDIKFENRTVEGGLEISVTADERPGKVISKRSRETVIGLLKGLPHGVLAMSMDIPDLVETSTNLAIVNLEEDALKVEMSTRSSVNSALPPARDIIHAVSELAGAEIEAPPGYPGWTPDLDSEILREVSGVHEKLFGKEPEKKAIHAGLECGVIGEKFPGMDMVSFGPQIEHPHSPDERVLIPSVENFYTLIKAVLEHIAS